LIIIATPPLTLSCDHLAVSLDSFLLSIPVMRSGGGSPSLETSMATPPNSSSTQAHSKQPSSKTSQQLTDPTDNRIAHTLTACTRCRQVCVPPLSFFSSSSANAIDSGNLDVTQEFPNALRVNAVMPNASITILP